MHRHLPSLFNEFNELRNLLSSVDDLYEEKTHHLSGVTLYEDKDHVFVELALPGLTSEEIHISFDKGILWVKGESKKEEQKDKKDFKYHTVSSKSFSYRIPLPTKVDEGLSPKAKLKNGILAITFEKARSSKPQQITIHEES
ncbi:MAG: Hsp20/alpha crystallin family protein [Chlamydiae bacterium]|jgi:HSP20 family protein|nr:Hsp20/alpha crystallin family protein [Chlamydiota bacterium]